MHFNDDSSTLQQVMEASASLSKNLMRIDPCLPADGTLTISANTYFRWRSLLLSTVDSMSEVEQECFFRKSAGAALMDVLQMLPESQYADPSSPTPFSDLISRLDKFFSSDSTRRSARLEFKTMKQDTAKGESNIMYLSRMTKAAMNCGFLADEFDEKIMNAISKNSSDRKIRGAANEIDRNGKRYTFTQFRDFILHLEQFRNNERSHTEEKLRNRQVPVHAVDEGRSGGMDRSSYQPAGACSFNNRDPSRTRPGQYRQQQTGNQRRTCSRCGGWDHVQASCPHRFKVCHNCNRTGQDLSQQSSKRRR